MSKTLDQPNRSNYNVITMKAKIIRIGNSRGVRIPKALLEEAKLTEEAEITLEKGALVIRPIKPDIKFDEGILWSYPALAKEWNTPEEDEAWAYLQ